METIRVCIHEIILPTREPGGVLSSEKAPYQPNISIFKSQCTCSFDTLPGVGDIPRTGSSLSDKRDLLQNFKLATSTYKQCDFLDT